MLLGYHSPRAPGGRTDRPRAFRAARIDRARASRDDPKARRALVHSDLSTALKHANGQIRRVRAPSGISNTTPARPAVSRSAARDGPFQMVPSRERRCPRPRPRRLAGQRIAPRLPVRQREIAPRVAQARPRRIARLPGLACRASSAPPRRAGVRRVARWTPRRRDWRWLDPMSFALPRVERQRHETPGLRHHAIPRDWMARRPKLPQREEEAPALARLAADRKRSSSRAASRMGCLFDRVQQNGMRPELDEHRYIGLEQLVDARQSNSTGSRMLRAPIAGVESPPIGRAAEHRRLDRYTGCRPPA